MCGPIRRAARNASKWEIRGSIFDSASPAVTSAAATHRRINTPPNISTRLNIRSCDRLSREKTGAGALWTRSCCSSLRRSRLTNEFLKPARDLRFRLYADHTVHLPAAFEHEQSRNASNTET